MLIVTIFAQVPTAFTGRCAVEAMALLRGKGIETLMVEGGGAIITAFLKAQLADALVITLAPILVGGYKAVDDLGASNKGQLPRIEPFYSAKLGNDLILWGDLQYLEDPR